MDRYFTMGLYDDICKECAMLHLTEPLTSNEIKSDLLWIITDFLLLMEIVSSIGNSILIVLNI